MSEILPSYWTIELFGGPLVRYGHTTIRLKTSKTSELLAFLALHPGRHSREYLTELLWSATDDPTAGRASLRTALSSLSKQLEPRPSKGGLLVVDQASIGLDLAMCKVDVKEFLDLLRQARHATTLEARIKYYEAATTVYKAPLLSNFESEWIDSDRRYLAEEAQTALLKLTESLVAARQQEKAIVCARQLLRSDGENEEATRLLMLLYAESGQKQSALKAFSKLKQALRERYDLEVSPELCELAEQIRLPAGFLPRLQEVYSAAVPPSVMDLSPAPQEPVSAKKTPPLPPRTTTFFGRHEEIWQIVSHLSPRDPPDISQVQLITLTGMGGIGKTRLAVEAGRILQEKFARFAYVSLANLLDSRWVADAILQALSIPRDPEMDAIEQLVESLRAHPTLLLLDNFEQLLDGETHGCDGAAVMMRLQERLPALRCLITSRQPLRIAGEWELRVRALPVPPGERRTPSELSCYPSVQLYLHRAQEKKPDFTLTEHTAPDIAELCSRLDGIPLALELAAACLNDYSPARILRDFDDRFSILKSRFRDHDERHQTLYTAIDWSYQNLSARHQDFFLTLGVFRGRFTAPAAAAVSGCADALAYLEILRDRSLLLEERHESASYFVLLDTLRDYARQNLAEEQKARLLRRHAAYYYRLAQRTAFLDGMEQVGALDMLERELDNLRACLHFLSKSKLGLRMTGALHYFWYVRGHIDEGLRFMEQILPQCRNVPIKLRSSVYNGMGVFAWKMGDYEKATLLLRQALEDRNALQDVLGVAGLDNNLGLLAEQQGDLQEAGERMQRCIAVYRQLGQRRLLAGGLDNLAGIYIGQQNLSAAAPLLEECRTLLKERGDNSIAASMHTHQAQLAYHLGDRSQAHQLFQEAMRLREGLKANREIASLLLQLARLALERGLMPRSVTLCAAAVKLSEICRFKLDTGDNTLLDRSLEKARLSLSSNRYASSWSHGYSLPQEEVVKFACELILH